MTGPEAVVWPMSEAAAVLLDRSLGWSEQKTAMKMEWLLAELEQRFRYSLEELAQRLDRSVSWVSRPLALVELSPQEIQQHARGQPMLPRAWCGLGHEVLAQQTRGYRMFAEPQNWCCSD